MQICSASLSLKELLLHSVTIRAQRLRNTKGIENQGQNSVSLSRKLIRILMSERAPQKKLHAFNNEKNGIQEILNKDSHMLFNIHLLVLYIAGCLREVLVVSRKDHASTLVFMQQKIQNNTHTFTWYRSFVVALLGISYHLLQRRGGGLPPWVSRWSLSKLWPPHFMAE